MAKEGTEDWNTVYIETNIGTRLTVVFPSDETFTDLKKRVLYEHILLFPHYGNIKIDALKVKPRRKFYDLTESLLVKSFFHGEHPDNWIIVVDVVLESNYKESVDQLNNAKSMEISVNDHVLRDNQLLLEANPKSQPKMESTNLKSRVDSTSIGAPEKRKMEKKSAVAIYPQQINSSRHSSMAKLFEDSETPKLNKTMDDDSILNDLVVANSTSSESCGEKRKNRRNWNDDGEKRMRRQLLCRYWSEKDVVNLLEAALLVRNDPKSDKETKANFYKLVKDSICFEVTESQVGKKLTRLKTQYKSNVLVNKNGDALHFANENERLVFELSAKLWGRHCNNKNSEEEEEGIVCIECGKDIVSVEEEVRIDLKKKENKEIAEQIQDMIIAETDLYLKRCLLMKQMIQNVLDNN